MDVCVFGKVSHTQPTKVSTAVVADHRVTTVRLLDKRPASRVGTLSEGVGVLSQKSIDVKFVARIAGVGATDIEGTSDSCHCFSVLEVGCVESVGGVCC